ncbi:hypothetical protein PF005_g21488, partial [Phytophthora fragariae]
MLVAGPAYANTARPCFAGTPRGFALATLLATACWNAYCRPTSTCCDVEDQRPWDPANNDKRCDAEEYSETKYVGSVHVKLLKP